MTMTGPILLQTHIHCVSGLLQHWNVKPIGRTKSPTQSYRVLGSPLGHFTDTNRIFQSLRVVSGLPELAVTALSLLMPHCLMEIRSINQIGCDLVIGPWAGGYIAGVICVTHLWRHTSLVSTAQNCSDIIVRLSMLKDLTSYIRNKLFIEVIDTMIYLNTSQFVYHRSI
jgi:hypothetical protein